ncbi:MAG: GntR family transcriptional regulator [Chloroflexi bacterium]|nr:GntR family transcriptional regulator [Chloroflexota bacterium]MCL5276035.1 GntR family transcriptional regulator [Chloroflexota bacterium]
MANHEDIPDANASRKLHQEIETRIRQYIEDHKLEAGDQLPTEAQFCRLFKVSRSTVRRAFKQLVSTGYISRTRGKGTFLSDPALPAMKSAPSLYSNNRGGKTRLRMTIGAVFSYANENDIMHTMILGGIEHAAKAHGYNVLSGRTDDQDDAGELRAISDLCNIGVSGLIVMPISNRAVTPGVQMLIEQHIPVVLVDRYLSDLNASHVVSDNSAGMYGITEHLILLGYQSFEFVVGLQAGGAREQMGTTSVRDRYQGYCRALRTYGLADAIREPIAVDVANQDSVRNLFAQMGRTGARPPAIVALHDYVATEVMNTARQIGLNPPDDYAIVGFDDLPIASHLAAPLTTVAQPRYDIGFRAGHMLVDMIAGNPIRNDKLSLLVSMVVRESCGAHRIMRAAQQVGAA